MSTILLLEALAEAFEAAGSTLRQKIAVLKLEDGTVAATTPTIGVVARVRAYHSQLGPRQAEVLQVLEDAGWDGTTAGAIAEIINYDQPNVYLTLQGLIGGGYVEKDDSVRPHRYRLAPNLLPPKE
jgi:DNA-binding MarR family transcriptional regulator